MIEKRQPVRSQKLRRSARGQPCVLRIPGRCNGDPDTTVLAHAPLGGRGMARKASDVHAVFACSGCHAVLDGHIKADDVPLEELWECVIRGIAETQQTWWEQGLLTVKGAA